MHVPVLIQFYPPDSILLVPQIIDILVPRLVYLPKEYAGVCGLTAYIPTLYAATMKTATVRTYVKYHLYVIHCDVTTNRPM